MKPAAWGFLRRLLPLHIQQASAPSSPPPDAPRFRPCVISHLAPCPTFLPSVPVPEAWFPDSSPPSPCTTFFPSDPPEMLTCYFCSRLKTLHGSPLLAGSCPVIRAGVFLKLSLPLLQPPLLIPQPRCAHTSGTLTPAQSTFFISPPMARSSPFSGHRPSVTGLGTLSDCPARLPYHPGHAAVPAPAKLHGHCSLGWLHRPPGNSKGSILFISIKEAN